MYMYLQVFVYMLIQYKYLCILKNKMVTPVSVLLLCTVKGIRLYFVNGLHFSPCFGHRQLYTGQPNMAKRTWLPWWLTQELMLTLDLWVCSCFFVKMGCIVFCIIISYAVGMVCYKILSNCSNNITTIFIFFQHVSTSSFSTVYHTQEVIRQ